MKPRHLLLSVLLVLASAQCSDDDEQPAVDASDSVISDGTDALDLAAQSDGTQDVERVEDALSDQPDASDQPGDLGELSDSDSDSWVVTLTVPDYDQTSRQQEVVLTVTNPDAEPVPDLEVAFAQMSQDFVFGLGPAQAIYADGQEELITEFGANGTTGAAFTSWFNTESPPPYDYAPILDEVEGHLERLHDNWGVEHYAMTIGIEPLYALHESVPDPPDWIDFDDLEGFVKPAWLALVTEVVPRQWTDLYLIEGGPISWLDPALDPTNFALIQWEIEQIKALDPDARCFVSVSGCNSEADTTRDYFIALTAAGVEYDGLAIEYHPGLWDCPTDLQLMVDYYDELAETYGVDLYIWETFTISQGSELYPDPGWYNEDWQAEAMAGMLQVAFENPAIVGINYLHFQDHLAQGEDINLYEGFVRIDGTPKPSYEATREYWWSTFVEGLETTDVNGQVSFTGAPGEYDVTIGESALTVGFERLAYEVD